MNVNCAPKHSRQLSRKDHTYDKCTKIQNSFETDLFSIETKVVDNLFKGEYDAASKTCCTICYESVKNCVAYACTELTEDYIICDFYRNRKVTDCETLLNVIEGGYIKTDL